MLGQSSRWVSWGIEAFVDSKAQSTIISKSCAERCGLSRLLDTWYRGIAQGVGQSEIIGRIHVAPIKVGNNFYLCTFTVLDSPNMELLFGLDMLRKHQENVLRFGGEEVSVPFLAALPLNSTITIPSAEFSCNASEIGFDFCTINQPIINIFCAFDERGGQVIYAGRLGLRSRKLVEYFEDIPRVPNIKEGFNPATWMLDVSYSAAEAQLDVDFAEIYVNSDLYERNQDLIKELSTLAPGLKDLYFPTQYSQPFLIKFFTTVTIGILFGIIFWQKGDQINRQQDLLNLLGATCAAVLLLGATNASAVQSVVAIERTVFYRERAAGMYLELSYAFAQTFVYSLLLYSMIGYHWTGEKFYFYYFIFMCFTYFSTYASGTYSPVSSSPVHLSQFVEGGTAGLLLLPGQSTGKRNCGFYESTCILFAHRFVQFSIDHSSESFNNRFHEAEVAGGLY
ncbi:unnamed protein product [Fraxinus pennsylvanica]|uniref:Uncharacterized protein n=1 Tax=Fraxinus pennsylvanica TaxID=56036 RepID=A0AAD2A791_9LAMI|nr:unnamed protein product [Fraxinus pennsylvanica]